MAMSPTATARRSAARPSGPPTPDRAGGALRAAHRRRGADRGRGRGGVRGRRLVAVLDPSPPGSSTSTRSCSAPAWPRPCSSCPSPTSPSPAACAGATASWRSTARAAARPTSGAPSTPTAGRGCTAMTSRRSRRAPPRRLRRRRVGVRAPVRTRARAEHAGGRAPARGGVPLHQPAAGHGNPSTFALSSWDFEARDGNRRIAVEVDAPRETLVGVTYSDPDGELAYCYNSEVASLRLPRLRSRPGRAHRLAPGETLARPGRAHFEYAQREPAGLELHVR